MGSSRRLGYVLGLALSFSACSGDLRGGRSGESDDAGSAGSDETDASEDSAREATDAGGSDPSFERPDPDVTYDPKAGDCGFDKPAFLRHVRDARERRRQRR
jgi:hypothetical protein